MKVCVLQVDSREILFGNFSLCVSANVKQCRLYGFDHIIKKIEPVDHLGCCHRYAKVNMVRKVMESSNYDLLVFLDTDAWIQEPAFLKGILEDLTRSSKIGCFSREPTGGLGLYNAGSCFVNSGSFVVKCSNEALVAFNQIHDSVNEDIYKNKRLWPNDQLHISNYVYRNRDKFYVFKDVVFNTPNGKVLRHNWFKDLKMQNDLNLILGSDFVPSSNTLNLLDLLDSSEYTGPYKGCYRII